MPVGFARDLPVQRVMRADIGGTDLAIWRSASGKLAAWGNRCPHRGMRLSHGFVRGEALACLYHGWHYGSSGNCTYIPAHPELTPPKTIKAEIYAVREQDGVLWVSTQGDIVVPPLPENLRALRSLALECDLATAMSAFLQMPVSPGTPPLSGGRVLPGHSNALVFDAENSAEAVAILFQPTPGASVTAHILARDTWPSRNLVALSRWSEAVRRAAES